MFNIDKELLTEINNHIDSSIEVKAYSLVFNCGCEGYCKNCCGDNCYKSAN